MFVCLLKELISAFLCAICNVCIRISNTLLLIYNLLFDQSNFCIVFDLTVYGFGYFDFIGYLARLIYSYSMLFIKMKKVLS